MLIKTIFHLECGAMLLQIKNLEQLQQKAEEATHGLKIVGLEELQHGKMTQYKILGQK